MVINKYEVFSRSHEKNIIYIEGMDDTGNVNEDSPNVFNDLRLVIGFNNSTPVIEGAWPATTEPGFWYTDNPMNADGAARIAFGQYRSWQIGIHGNSDPHEALVQVADVKVHRDYNRDMVRLDDAIDEGLFGINQHWGYDMPIDDIGLASAGCLVGRTRNGHRKFMKLIKSNPRYLADADFIFTTAILDGSKL